MFSRLLDVLNVRPEERTQVMLMLGAGFFMGIFFATYSVVAESLFLNNLGNELNKAFLISGCFGVLATIAFSFAQNKIKFSNLTTTSILVIVIVTSFFYVGYHFGPDEYKKPIIFAMFSLTGPITAVLLLSYWGIFGRLFNFKQSKRIIGWIDTGSLIAVILANFLIPLTSGIFGDTDNYLIVCALAIIVSAIFFIVISLKFPLIKNDPKEFDAAVLKETSMTSVLTDPYTKLLSIFLVISMVMLILGQFSFQELIKVQYPGQKELTNFLALFNGTIYVLSFVMQTFVNDRIVGNYGMRVGLMILPTVVAFFALSASLLGLTFGYTPETAHGAFIYFFLFIALMRLFNNMIRDSLENPLFKLLFTPIDSRSRFGIQSKVEGIVNESGRITAGALIFIFASLPFFRIVWMPVILAILAGLYFVVIQKLYAGYKAKIRSKLETVQSTSEKLEVGFDKVTQQLKAKLADEKPGAAVFSYKLLEKINPSLANQSVNALIRNPREETRDFAQRRMNEMKGLSVSDRYVIRYDVAKAHVSDKNLLTKSELELIIKSGGDITKTRIQKLARSTDPGDRQYAAELLLHTTADENTSYLIELLSDTEPKVRSTAIKTAVKKNNSEVIHALIENLGTSRFAGPAADALVLIGGKSLNILDSAFYRSGQTTVILIQIVQIIGRIGGQHGRELLWNKIDYPDKVVVSRVLLAMGESGFKAGTAQITRIKYAIENDIGDLTWNLCGISELGDEGKASLVKDALRTEIANDIDHIYMLLAMLYDTRSIQLVKENIESGTVEGTAFAVELLDVFLSEQLKQRVIPVLDDISDADRIKRLEDFYPRIALDEKLVLKFLINREFTQTNRWTKVTVLRQIGEMRVSEFALDLIAQLFNPDPLIQEMAAWSLNNVDPELFNTNVERLGHDTANRLNRIVRKEELMIFDKVEFLSSIDIFKGTSGISLSFLADSTEEMKLAPGSSFVLDERANGDFFIMYEGEVEYYGQGTLKSTFQRGQFIGEMLAAPGMLNSNILRARTDATLLRMTKEHLYELLSENARLAERVLDYV